MDIRSQILTGSLALPSSTSFKLHFGLTTTDVITRMFKASWNAYLLNKSSINLTYWARQFSSPKVFNDVLKQLCDNNWLVTHVIKERNWAEANLPEEKLLSYVSSEELELVRSTNKFNKYVPSFMKSEVSDLTKQNGRTKYTGLVRLGLKASSSTQFEYDTIKLKEHVDTITLNVNKGMRKVRGMFKGMPSDAASYDKVAAHIVKSLISNPCTYTMGNNYSDSRGRAIKEGLSKVANPVGYKDFRALLVIPKEYRNTATGEGVTAIALFIAELNCSKTSTILDKELFGMECYHSRYIHSADNMDEDPEELYERIWLERLYDDLDGYYEATRLGKEYGWSVPIEIDSSASMLSHLGLLLNDKRLLSMTNTIDTGELSDPWEFSGIGRQQFKAAATPMLYGSSLSVTELWDNAGHSYTPEQVALYNKEMQSGALGLANSFKEFLLRWVRPEETMHVHVYEDKFTIECNRFKNVGETTTHYDIYDSIDTVVRRLLHTETKKVPDLVQFTKFFPTLLIHGVDSQVIDFVMEIGRAHV